MATIYKHKTRGHEVQYKLYFINGTRKKKTKYYRKPTQANNAKKDLDHFEFLAKRGELEKKHIITALHMKYITEAEVPDLYAGNGTVPLVDPLGITWDTLKQYFLDHLTTVGTKRTVAGGKSKPDTLINYFQSRGLGPVDAADSTIIKEYILHRRSLGIQKATINKEISVLRKMLDYLTEKGILDKNPARDTVKYFRNLQENIPRPLFPAEFQKFLGALQDFSYLLHGYFPEMTLSYLHTGARRYELLELQTGDINFQQQYFIIGRSKSSKGRVVDISNDLVPVFQSVLDKNGRRKGKYFFGGYNHTVVREGEVSKAFKKFQGAINLPGGVKLHSLRHTFISYLIDSGANLKYVMDQVGQKRISTTQRYIHTIPSKDREIDKLNYVQYIDNKNEDD